MPHYHKPTPSDYRRIDAEYDAELTRADAEQARVDDAVERVMADLSCNDIARLLADEDGNVSPLAQLAADMLFDAASKHVFAVLAAVRAAVRERIEYDAWE